MSPSLQGLALTCVDNTGGLEVNELQVENHKMTGHDELRREAIPQPSNTAFFMNDKYCIAFEKLCCYDITVRVL